MTKPLQPFSVVAPGFKGINTQDSSVTLESGFALEAWNCVIDKQGRLASRKGHINRSAVSAGLGSSSVKALHEFVKNDATVEYLSAGNNKLFRGLTTLTDISPGGGYVISGNDWMFSNLNNHVTLVQRGQEPLIYHDPGGGYVLVRMTTHPGYTAPTAPITWSDVKAGISALGRTWVATDQVVYFSDLKQSQKWNGGTSGSLTVTDVWPDGTDIITGLAVHNGFLIIFGSRSILVYANAAIPANLSLQDTIVGVGCISQQTIQSTGAELLFVSDSGLRALSRVVQEKSLPMRDASKNVRDDFLAVVLSETTVNLRSVYFEKDAHYLLLCPATKQVWCFDTRGMLEDGSLRCTRWDKIVYTSFCASRERKLYVGTVGFIAEYAGYSDGGVKYVMKYRSNQFDMGNVNMTAIIKKLSLVATTSNNQGFVFKWGFDYTTSLDSESATFQGSVAAFEWGIAQYGLAEYTAGETLGDVGINPGGDGSVLQIGFDTDINGARVSVQKFSVYVKAGRII